ncbi:EpsG family protein, partial [Vibrio rumoiensis]|uniref:EpsG family protein n=1 Tax=Vibrio rumoiensis TaxID=76258 RepID=UPI0003671B69
MDKLLSLKYSYLSANLKRQLILFIYVIVSFLLFFLVRDVESSQDYLNYLNWFEDVIQTNDNVGFFRLKDPAFNLLSEVSHILGGGVFWVIFSLVSIAIFSKVIFLKRFEHQIILTFILLYFCKFFFVFELTQFRAAASISTATLAFFLFIDKKYLKSYMCLLVALAIHMSALLILLCIPLFLLIYKVKNQGRIVFILLLFLLFAVVFPFNFALLDNVPILGSRINPYINGEYPIQQLSLINSYLIVKSAFLFFYVIWFNCKKNKRIITVNYFYLHLFFYISYLSTFIFIVFRQNDVMALRVSEFFSLFDLLFFTLLVGVFNKESKLLFRLLLTLLCSVFLFSSIKLLNY